MLIAHAGAKMVSRQDVMESPTPPPEGSHYPVEHGLLLRSALKVLTDGDRFTIRKESHALKPDGSQYFGVIDLAGPEDYGLSIGIRNSHNKTLRAGLVMGTRVFVCDNLAMHGEVQIARKHTRWIERDLDRLVCEAMGSLGKFQATIAARIEQYKHAELPDSKAHDLIIRAVDVKALPGAHIPAVLEEYRQPSHEEFAPRNAWSLFNAFTEVGKKYSLEALSKRTQRLHGLFDAYVAS